MTRNITQNGGSTHFRNPRIELIETIPETGYGSGKNMTNINTLYASTLGLDKRLEHNLICEWTLKIHSKRISN